MRTKKVILEKLEDVKELAKMEHKNLHLYEDMTGDRNILLIMTGWIEALNFVLKRPVDTDVDVGKRKSLPDLRLD
tara:strand:+ start:123 stop:347 length:225 start_codon:yes stop_codon:yes gene_type:complete